MEEMKRDTEGFVLGIYRRFGWQPGSGFRQQLAQEASRGESYRSRHRYALEEFGLSPAALAGRFQELNQRFGWGREDGKTPPCAPEGRALAPSGEGGSAGEAHRASAISTGGVAAGEDDA